MIPTVSIVLPVRNAALTLRAAIASIRNQTFKDWELFIVDDGSTDGSAALATKGAHEDSRIHCLPSPARGIVAALNEGLRIAQGEFIARMDADDLSHPTRLQKQCDFLHAHPDVGLVSSRVEFGGDAGTAEGYALHVEWLNTLLTPDAIALNRFIESPLAHPSVMFRRSLPQQHGGYRDGAFPEDYELWLRWLDGGVRMAKMPETLFTWNDPPDRLSRRDVRYSEEAFYDIKARYLARELQRSGGGHDVWVWGAGRPTRLRSEKLTQHGIVIRGYIDVDPRKQGRVIHGCPVVSPEQLPDPENAVVLGYVANRGARELIRASLTTAGYIEGRDCWMAA